ncbi:hypothetical protein [Nitrosophilus kaiyonis]|uniref:hypothetical protein n=1 Tax=Nitrosophilus kaiyonis TaxID=2930200 RepID=UPI002493360B|nr:hypothetical protein [Nitrosophilus kaiyonis]
MTLKELFEIISVPAIIATLLGAIGFLSRKLLTCIATLKSLRSALIMLPNLRKDKLEKTIQKLLQENQIYMGEEKE